jgi:hypothetical protein
MEKVGGIPTTPGKIQGQRSWDCEDIKERR